MCVSDLCLKVGGGTRCGSLEERGRSTTNEVRRNSVQNGIAMKNQVCTCVSLLVRRPFFLVCVILDATLEAVEVAGLEPADVPPGEPRSVV